MAASGWEPESDDSPQDDLEPPFAPLDSPLEPPTAQPWPGTQGLRHSLRMISVVLPLVFLNLFAFGLTAVYLIQFDRRQWLETLAALLAQTLAILMAISLARRWPLGRLATGSGMLLANLWATSHLLATAGEFSVRGHAAASLMIGGIALGMLALAVGTVDFMLTLERWLHFEIDQLATIQQWWHTHRPHDPKRPPLPRFARARPPRLWRADRALVGLVLLAGFGGIAWSWTFLPLFKTRVLTQYLVIGWLSLSALAMATLWQKQPRWRLLGAMLALWTGLPLLIAASYQLCAAVSQPYSPTLGVFSNRGNWLVIAGWLIVTAAAGLVLWRTNGILRADLHALLQAAGSDRLAALAVPADEELAVASGTWDEGRSPPAPPSPSDPEKS